MSAELKAKFQRLADAWMGDPGALDEICDPGLVYHVAPFPDMDLDGLKQFIGGFRMAFPDFQVTLEEDLFAGDASAHRWTCQATYTGQSPLFPIQPTGKPWTVPGSHVVHWQEGKAVEMWHYGDWMGALQQAGVIPPLG